MSSSSVSTPHTTAPVSAVRPVRPAASGQAGQPAVPGGFADLLRGAVAGEPEAASERGDAPRADDRDERLADADTAAPAGQNGPTPEQLAERRAATGEGANEGDTSDDQGGSLVPGARHGRPGIGRPDRTGAARGHAVGDAGASAHGAAGAGHGFASTLAAAGLMGDGAAAATSGPAGRPGLAGGTGNEAAAAVETSTAAIAAPPGAEGRAAAPAEGFAAALAEAGAAAPTDAPAAASESAATVPTQAQIESPPGTEAFSEALGAQLHTWLEDGVEYATLELNPQDMGPIDVRIALVGGRTEIQLAADVAATREALSEALPGLAEALGDVGLQLAGGSVGDQTGRHAAERDGQAQRGYVLPAWLAPARDEAGSAATAGPRPGQRGLVDLVA